MRWLFRLFRTRNADTLLAAQVARQEAILELRRAKAIGDTRRIHTALRAAREATTRVVRLELAR